MSLAVVVIILHSIIAHDHKTGMSAEDHLAAHSCAVSVFDNFVLDFHIANGEGHLEHFVSSDTSFNHNLAVISLFSPSSRNFNFTERFINSPSR
jgi:hypothetical protein